MLLWKIKALVGKLSRPAVLWVKRRRFEEVLVLGDSHAKVFRNRKFAAGFRGHFFNVVSVPGATVSGLKNPNAKTQALPILRDGLRKSAAATTIVLLGEVDTGFVIWYRAEKYRTPAAVMADRALENYQALVLEISQKSRVICISTPLPTIQDGSDWGDVANARKVVSASQRERTALTLQFNRHMQQFCEGRGFTYLSFDRASLGENGLVNPALLNASSSDHHYDGEKYADMLIDKVRAVIAP